MRTSSLPDIFCKSTTETLALRKQGGPFSLNLAQQNSEQHLASRAGYAPGDQNYTTLSATKRRSASTASMRPRQSILRDQSYKKSDTARDKIQVGFKEEVQFWNNSVVKQKVGMSVFNLSNFPYQTNRKFNNMTVDLQEGESLKNKTVFSLKEADIVMNSIQQAIKETRQIRTNFHSFIREMIDDLDCFQEEFGGILGQTYSRLSRMRRETNSKVKQNRSEIDKLDSEFEVCSNFSRGLHNQSKSLYEECLLTPNEEDRARSPSPYLDFEQISTIPRTSRGATGDQSRRTRLLDLLKKSQRPRMSADWNHLLQNKGALTVNGHQLEVLSLQDC